MTEDQTAAAFNEWMRRYTDEPDAFSQQWQDVVEYLKEIDAGTEPTYGQTCAAYLANIMADLDAKALAP